MSKYTNTQKGFAQGYLCVIVQLLEREGCVSTQIKELWKGGGYKFSELENLGVDAYDIERLKPHQQSLENYPCDTKR